jgi:hypothetical protein
MSVKCEQSATGAGGWLCWGDQRNWETVPWERQRDGSRLWYILKQFQPKTGKRVTISKFTTQRQTTSAGVAQQRPGNQHFQVGAALVGSAARRGACHPTETSTCDRLPQRPHHHVMCACSQLCESMPAHQVAALLTLTQALTEPGGGKRSGREQLRAQLAMGCLTSTAPSSLPSTWTMSQARSSARKQRHNTPQQLTQRYTTNAPKQPTPQYRRVPKFWTHRTKRLLFL